MKVRPLKNGHFLAQNWQKHTIFVKNRYFSKVWRYTQKSKCLTELRRFQGTKTYKNDRTCQKIDFSSNSEVYKGGTRGYMWPKCVKNCRKIDFPKFVKKWAPLLGNRFFRVWGVKTTLIGPQNPHYRVTCHPPDEP